MAEKNNQINDYYIQTRPGLEEIAWLEIRDMLPNAKFGEYLFAQEQNGIVTFSYKGETADVNQLLTSEDEFLQALSLPKLSRGRQDLALVQEAVAVPPISSYVSGSLAARRLIACFAASLARMSIARLIWNEQCWMP